MPWIDRKLHEDQRDGYRYDGMPPQREAWRRGVPGSTRPREPSLMASDSWISTHPRRMRYCGASSAVIRPEQPGRRCRRGASSRACSA